MPATICLINYQIVCEQLVLEEKVFNIDHDKYFRFRVTMAVFAMATVILSTMSLGCIWHYERFGGDPRKRTILNQLIGLLALNNICGQLIGMLAFYYRLAISGPLSMTAAKIMFLVPNVTTSFVILLILDEIILIRWLSVFIWKQLPPLNDDFFGLFFKCLNFGLSLMFVIMGLTGGTSQNNLLFLLTGSYFPWEPKLTIKR